MPSFELSAQQKETGDEKQNHGEERNKKNALRTAKKTLDLQDSQVHFFIETVFCKQLGFDIVGRVHERLCGCLLFCMLVVTLLVRNHYGAFGNDGRYFGIVYNLKDLGRIHLCGNEGAFRAGYFTDQRGLGGSLCGNDGGIATQTAAQTAL